VTAFAPWQALLDGIGWLVAQIYELIPNYGVTIILLTVLIRLVLLPLGIRQVRSMQHMQIIQPKVKQLQQKFKGNKQRQQEEIMKLYKEYGVNPFSGCWPVLLQFPILIAMYSVLRFPQHPIHIPADTELYAVVTQQIPQVTVDDDGNEVPITSQAQIETLVEEGALPGPASGTSFLGMNLLCSASQAGNQDAMLGDRVSVGQETVNLEYPVDCGGNLNRIPYYLFAVLMFGTTYYQQRQMQKASPPGAASSQQQALLKIMPLMFGVFGIFFPAGLVVYWTTSNAWQIGQQYYMLRTRPTAESLAAAAADGKKGADPQKKGFMASMMERAEDQRNRRQGTSGKPGTAGRKPGTAGRKPGTPKPGGGSRPNQSKKPQPGGSDGGDPKKRP
jgi:YidC/Oxa1 family membrane protein insertase